MNEQEWIGSALPVPMLEFLRGKAGDRKLRLCAVACCRNVWQMLTDDGRKLIKVAERIAEGKAESAESEVQRLATLFPSSTPDDAAILASIRRYDIPSVLFRYRIVDISQFDQEAERRIENICTSAVRFPVDAAAAVCVRANASNCSVQSVSQTSLLRDIFGNPFRPVTIDPRWLTSTVVDLSRAIYDESAFDKMPILADALMYAGCDSEDILAHCRGPGPHVRGCWVVDLLLGKE